MASTSTSHDLLDDNYYWSKHAGPDPEKNYTRSPKFDCFEPTMKKTGYLIKTIHVSPGKGCLNKKEHIRLYDALNNDFQPFIIYSLHKRKRWEVRDEYEPTVLEKLERFNNYEQVLFINRYWTTEYTYMMFITRFWSNYHLFPIYEVKYLDHDPEALVTYVGLKNQGVRGQAYDNYMKENRQGSSKRPKNFRRRQKWVDVDWTQAPDPTLVTYQFIDGVPNYRKVMKKNVECPGSCCEPTRFKKIEFRQQTFLDLRFGTHLAEQDPVDIDGDDEGELFVEDDDLGIKKVPQEFYRLEEHFKV